MAKNKLLCPGVMISYSLPILQKFSQNASFCHEMRTMKGQSVMIRLNLKNYASVPSKTDEIMVVFMRPASLCISFSVLDVANPPSEIFSLRPL